MKWSLLWEATKEPLRLLILGLISFLIAHLSGLPQDKGTAFFLLILRLVDKLLHEYGLLQEEERSTKKIAYKSPLTTGLTRF